MVCIPPLVKAIINNMQLSPLQSCCPIWLISHPRLLSYGNGQGGSEWYVGCRCTPIADLFLSVFYFSFDEKERNLINTYITERWYSPAGRQGNMGPGGATLGGHQVAALHWAGGFPGSADGREQPQQMQLPWEQTLSHSAYRVTLLTCLDKYFYTT